MDENETPQKKRAWYVRGAKFTFWSIPLSLIGWGSLKRGNQTIRSLWRSIFNVRCPQCKNGIMLEDGGQQLVEQDGDKTRVLTSWCCSTQDCGCRFLAENKEHLQQQVATMQKNVVKVELTGMQKKEVDGIALRHKVISRIFYFFSFVAFSGAVYMLYSNAAPIIFIDWLCITAVFWIFGMKRAYRVWQVNERRIYEKGAFWEWLNTGRWFV